MNLRFVLLGGSIFAAVFLVAAIVTEFTDESRLARDNHQNKCTFLKRDPEARLDPTLTPERPNTNVVKVIRLTNQGEFVDRCELTDALNEMVWDRRPPSCRDKRPEHEDLIRRGECDERGPTVKADAVEKPKLIVLFVHGWTHNAREGDPNYVDFKAMISELSKDSTKQVVGVYVTWNASTGNAVLDLASFWSRQRIADRITQSGVITRIVSMISTNRSHSGHRDQFIAIGHSFGARMLFAAINPPMIFAAANAFPKAEPHVYKDIDAVADAVVLLNPAFEASRYATINGIMRNEETFSPTQRPLLVAISTDNDWSTRYLFPLGQYLGFSFDWRAGTTLGNYSDYYTHSLLPSTEDACPTSALTERFFAVDLCLRRETEWHYKPGTKDESDPYGWAQVRPESQKHNPFLVVRTTSKVINGHSEIWKTKGSLGWLLAFVRAINSLDKVVTR